MIRYKLINTQSRILSVFCQNLVQSVKNEYNAPSSKICGSYFNSWNMQHWPFWLNIEHLRSWMKPHKKFTIFYALSCKTALNLILKFLLYLHQVKRDELQQMKILFYFHHSRDLFSVEKSY